MDPLIEHLPSVTLTVLLVAAVGFDLKFRIIPNWICGTVLAFGLLHQGVQMGGAGVEKAVLGVLLGLGIFVPLYAKRWIGGGDTKLIAALGAFLGPTGILNAVLFTFLAGGLMAMGHIVSRKGVVVAPWLLRYYAADGSGRVYFPYALAIAVGALCANFFSLTSF